MLDRLARHLGRSVGCSAALLACFLVSSCGKAHGLMTSSLPMPTAPGGTAGPPQAPAPGSGSASASTSVAPPGYLLSKVSPQVGLPDDAVPMDVDRKTGRIVLSSFSSGLFEMEWPPGQAAPTIRRSWKEDVIGHVGEARYAAGGTIYVNVHGKGLAKVTERGVSVIGTADGLVNADLLDILVRSTGEVWVVGVPNPFGAGGAGVQILVNDRPSKIIPTENVSVGTLRSSLDMPARRSVFATTAAGVVELTSKGLIGHLSGPGRVNRLARQPGGGTGAIGAVGSVVERWDGTRFVLMTEPFRMPPTSGSSWAPEDLAIAPNGNWAIICGDDVLSVIDSAGKHLGQFDASSGVPASSRRVLLLADGRRILVGGEHGTALMSW